MRRMFNAKNTPAKRVVGLQSKLTQCYHKDLFEHSQAKHKLYKFFQLHLD